MDNNNVEEKIVLNELNQEQLKDLTDGMNLKDLTHMAGWKILEGWLKSRALHSWVDPRGLKKEDWEWAELNAYHSADVAKELLVEVQEAIDKAEQLENFRLGKEQPNKMRI